MWSASQLPGNLYAILQSNKFLGNSNHFQQFSKSLVYRRNYELALFNIETIFYRDQKVVGNKHLPQSL